eukprot:s1010_g11.t1
MESAGKNPWWKAIIRLVDKKGQGLYAEVRGGLERVVQARAQLFFQPKYVQLSDVELKQNSIFMASFSADVTKTGKVSPVAEAHPSVGPLRNLFPIARSDFGRLKEHCQGFERIDVIGKVTAKETPALRVPKVTLRLKDESSSELAVHLWGPRMTRLRRERVEKLKALSDERGTAVSTPWLQTGAHRIKTDGLEKFISCCATAEDKPVEVQLNSVWVTGVVGDPVYAACKNCRTKIDSEAGHCKRHDTQGCQTERDEEDAILAIVNLADHTGELEKVLVDAPALCELTMIPKKTDLLELVAKRGSQSLCFRQPMDVVAAKLALHKIYEDGTRPMIRKVLRVEKQRPTGMVYPISCPYQDLSFSGFGVKLRDAAIFPNYITMLIRAEDLEPTIQKTVSDGDGMHMMQYKKVVAVEAQQVKSFCVEAFCHLQQTHVFNMCDGKVHMLIGKVAMDDDSSEVTVVAEKLFKLDTEEQLEAFQAEKELILALQHMETKKRPASDLVLETPNKVKAGKWLVVS